MPIPRSNRCIIGITVPGPKLRTRMTTAPATKATRIEIFQTSATRSEVPSPTAIAATRGDELARGVAEHEHPYSDQDL